MRKYDLISSLFLSVCGILITAGSSRLHVGTFENPGLGLFPLLTGILLAVLSIVLFLRSFMQRPSEEEPMPRRPARLWRKVAPTVGVMLFYAVFIDRWGFLLVTLLVLFILFKTIGNLSLKLSLGGALLASFISYLLFRVVLNVQLPPGPLGL